MSASAYYRRATGRRSIRAIEDERLLGRIRAIHAANYYAYGSRRMWKALRRAGEPVGRGRVERLMRAHGICGAKRRGKPWRTTVPELAARRRPDLVDRDFKLDPLKSSVLSTTWGTTLLGLISRLEADASALAAVAPDVEPPPIDEWVRGFRARLDRLDNDLRDLRERYSLRPS